MWPRTERKVPGEANDAAGDGSNADAATTGVVVAEAKATGDAQAARRAEREAERQAREAATRFNLELGHAEFTTLSRVKVDEPVLKVLAWVEVVAELADVAMRGAR